MKEKNIIFTVFLIKKIDKTKKKEYFGAFSKF